MLYFKEGNCAFYVFAAPWRVGVAACGLALESLWLHSAVAVSAVAIIIGEAENTRFEQQQLQSKMVFRPYFTKLYPDLRAAQRFGKEREDKDPVHIWVSVDSQGAC